MLPDTETSASNGEASTTERVPVPADLIRQQIRRQRRRHMRSARQRSKHHKRMRLALIVMGQAIFLLLLIYVWFKVSSAVQ